MDQIVVTSAQMRDIESRIFAAGMPVAALMEKVAGLISRHIQLLYPLPTSLIKEEQYLIKIGVLVGPGHNGGDALVVARELYFRGYEVSIYCPFTKLKELTNFHYQYVQSLGIPSFDNIEQLAHCDLLIDGLFGFGLEKPLTEPIVSVINQINQWSKPVISIDLPSGLHTDTGKVLGNAIRATHTLCLGLWKLGLLQEEALNYIGKAVLIPFDIPLADVEFVLAHSPSIHRITSAAAIANLPLPRPLITHKYKMGHLLLICGSHRYAGAAILTALAARCSGVGMLSIAVPASLKSLLVAQLPEALIIACPETVSGAIASLPEISLNAYNAIACGPGLTTDAQFVVETVINSDCPLILDADGLNILANMGTIPTLLKRQSPTILTPHVGEFKRLFPNLLEHSDNRIDAIRQAAAQTGTIILLKGARTAIANAEGNTGIIPESTPALARGGSGDVLTGLMGGLIAQTEDKLLHRMIQTAAWWHSQAGILAAQERTELGVDAHTLTQYLIPVLSNFT